MNTFRIKLLVLLLMLSFNVYAVDININDRENIDLKWTHPTTYTDGDPLPIENILSTAIERNCGAGWLEIAAVIAPLNIYFDPTASIGVAACKYRFASIAIGAVIGSKSKSDYSNIVEVNLYIPKQPSPPIATAE